MDNDIHYGLLRGNVIGEFMMASKDGQILDAIAISVHGVGGKALTKPKKSFGGKIKGTMSEYTFDLPLKGIDRWGPYSVRLKGSFTEQGQLFTGTFLSVRTILGAYGGKLYGILTTRAQKQAGLSLANKQLLATMQNYEEVRENSGARVAMFAPVLSEETGTHMKATGISEIFYGIALERIRPNKSFHPIDPAGWSVHYVTKYLATTNDKARAYQKRNINFPDYVTAGFAGIMGPYDTIVYPSVHESEVGITDRLAPGTYCAKAFLAKTENAYSQKAAGTETISRQETANVYNNYSHKFENKQVTKYYDVQNEGYKSYDHTSKSPIFMSKPVFFTITDDDQGIYMLDLPHVVLQKDSASYAFCDDGEKSQKMSSLRKSKCKEQCKTDVTIKTMPTKNFM